MNYRILISDDLHPACQETFRSEPEFAVEDRPGLSPEELQAIIGAYDGLIARSSTQVTASIIEAADRLKVIGRTGVGVDNIDVQTATQRGILVVNTPDINTVPTAEHTLALLLCLIRKISQAQISLKKGEWQRDRFSGLELSGKTLGLVGFGRVGRAVAYRARAFGMDVVAFDPYVSPEEIDGREVDPVDLNDLLARSDIISLHVPLKSETRKMIGRTQLEKCKDGVFLINCARGGLIDEAALSDALNKGKVAGAALDVFEQEPPVGSDLLKLENVVATPHIGGLAQGIAERAGRSIARQIINYLKRGEITNAVNAT